ncbi:sigma-70 family RNA polymerase sigma factor [Sphingobacterium spiritivorum]|nr:sigma-70 family RNA polymerase sigma factor [Sphingobacterium spiritivorum]QQT35249.1 sigma-70 family RNA polymerase sigma factor [Sphingobacterium spiritivorum]WQD36163.1 sigma-70 family RNA polymerase sigma factor [Sphingobacterium spiritivorum]SUJ04329.1 RNA polymerase sigma factor [Sphingobacterium spiritivorum]
MAAFENWDDHRLMTELKTNSELAFNVIYFRYSIILYRYAFNILRDEDECTDVVQEIFVWLWENRENLHISNLKSYLMAAVRYRMIRVIATSKRKEEILARSISGTALHADDFLEVKELKNFITDFTASLPLRARATFQLSREQYLSNREIALELGVSEKTVEAQMTISLKKLRLYLNRMFG